MTTSGGLYVYTLLEHVGAYLNTVDQHIPGCRQNIKKSLIVCIQGCFDSEDFKAMLATFEKICSRITQTHKEHDQATPRPAKYTLVKNYLLNDKSTLDPTRFFDIRAKNPTYQKKISQFFIMKGPINLGFLVQFSEYKKQISDLQTQIKADKKNEEEEKVFTHTFNHPSWIHLSEKIEKAIATGSLVATTGLGIVAHAVIPIGLLGATGLHLANTHGIDKDKIICKDTQTKPLHRIDVKGKAGVFESTPPTTNFGNNKGEFTGSHIYKQPSKSPHTFYFTRHRSFTSDSYCTITCYTRKKDRACTRRAIVNRTKQITELESDIKELAKQKSRATRQASIKEIKNNLTKCNQIISGSKLDFWWITRYRNSFLRKPLGIDCKALSQKLSSETIDCIFSYVVCNYTYQPESIAVYKSVQDKINLMQCWADKVCQEKNTQKHLSTCAQAWQDWLQKISSNMQ